MAGKPIPHPRGVGAEPPAPTISYSYKNQGERQYRGSALTQPAARWGAGSNLGAGGCPLGSCMNSEGGGRGLILLQHQEQAGNRSPMREAVEERGASHCSGTPSRRTPHGTARGSHPPHGASPRGAPGASRTLPSHHTGAVPAWCRLLRQPRCDSRSGAASAPLGCCRPPDSQPGTDGRRQKLPMNNTRLMSAAPSRPLAQRAAPHARPLAPSVPDALHGVPHQGGPAMCSAPTGPAPFQGFPAMPMAPMGSAPFQGFPAMPMAPMGSAPFQGFPAMPMAPMGSAPFQGFPAMPMAPTGSAPYQGFPAMPMAPMGSAPYQGFPAMPLAPTGPAPFQGFPAMPMAPTGSAPYQGFPAMPMAPMDPALYWGASTTPVAPVSSTTYQDAPATCVAPTDPVLCRAAPVGAGALLQQGGLEKGTRDRPSTPETLSENAAGSASSVSGTGLAGEEHVGATARGSPAPVPRDREQRRRGRTALAQHLSLSLMRPWLIRAPGRAAPLFWGFGCCIWETSITRGVGTVSFSS
ncbi:uncharacterized protein ACIBXB_019106 [Morphnus guianensis]